MSKNRLHKLVADVCAEITNISSESKVNISYEPFEDVDVTIQVHPPDEEAGEVVDEAIHKLTYEILLDEGYHISVLVLEPEKAQEER
jgi:hypothetical protein